MLKAFGTFGGMIALGAFAIRYIEKDQNFSWVDGIYWACSTCATVGYGDLAARTNSGKIFSIVYILFGTLVTRLQIS